MTLVNLPPSLSPLPVRFGEMRIPAPWGGAFEVAGDYIGA